MNEILAFHLQCNVTTKRNLLKLIRRYINIFFYLVNSMNICYSTILTYDSMVNCTEFFLMMEQDCFNVSYFLVLNNIEYDL